MTIGQTDPLDEDDDDEDEDDEAELLLLLLLELDADELLLEEAELLLLLELDADELLLELDAPPVPASPPDDDDVGPEPPGPVAVTG